MSSNWDIVLAVSGILLLCFSEINLLNLHFLFPSCWPINIIWNGHLSSADFHSTVYFAANFCCWGSWKFVSYPCWVFNYYIVYDSAVSFSFLKFTSLCVDLCMLGALLRPVTKPPVLPLETNLLTFWVEWVDQDYVGIHIHIILSFCHLHPYICIKLHNIL